MDSYWFMCMDQISRNWHANWKFRFQLLISATYQFSGEQWKKSVVCFDLMYRWGLIRIVGPGDNWCLYSFCGYGMLS